MASEELLAEHYIEHKESTLQDLVEYMSSDLVVAIVVEGDRVIEGVRNLIGNTNPTQPGTIRGDLGRDWGTGNVENIVHGSDSPASADREIALWFPELVWKE